MIRKLMASCAIAALMSGGAIGLAYAQTEPAKPAVTEDTAAAPPATEAAPVTELAASEAVLTPEKPTLASVYIGRSVFSSADPESDNIGDINDLIVGEDGAITHAVVGVGGFLGMGEKDVAVPFDELEVVQSDGNIKLIYAATREQLEAAPALDRTAFDPTAVQTTAATDSAAPIAPAPTGDAAAPADQAAVDTTEAPAPVEPAAPATDMAAAPAEPAAPADDAAAPAEQDLAAEAPAEPAPPADETIVQAPSDQATPAAPAEEVAAAEPTPPMDADLAFTSLTPDQVRASTLMGKAVYGPDDQSIGEISDLMLQKEGGTRVAVIDVGGFLGVGEKTVGIPFEELKFSKTEENVEPKITVAMTKEQLEQLPTFDTGAPADTAATETMPAPDTTTAPAPDTTASTEQPAATPPAEQPADQMAAAPATDQMTTGSVGASQDVAASKLIGAGVFGTDDASIGEVSDIVFAPKGEIEAVIVDVGGFLGIGEKPVALNFDKLNITTDDAGTMKVSVNATKEQLDQAPAYEVTIQ